MMQVCILDTSVFCEILEVFGKRAHTQEVQHQFKRYMQAKNTTFVLPFATIWETGNHITQNYRPATAQRFVASMQLAIARQHPWQIGTVLDEENWRDYLRKILQQFPSNAELGIGWGDLSIVEEYHMQCEAYPHRRIFIWSLDHHLSHYDRAPSGMSNLDY